MGHRMQGDLNGDGEPEIIVATHDATLQVWCTYLHAAALQFCSAEWPTVRQMPTS